MPNLNVNILGRDGNTRAKVTGQEELLVSIGSFGPSASGLATEATLKNIEGLSSLILAAIQAGTEYEAALVVDAADVTWLEIRVYNQSTGTFDSPVYYQAGSNAPGTPTAPITYINPNSYLAQIVSNTTGLATEITLGLLEAKDFATQTTLQALLTAFNAEDFATETTLALIEDVIDNMTFTGGDLNVSANIQVGGTDVSNANPVPISDAGGSITVDGTVTANQGTSPWAVSLPTGTNTSFYNRMLGAPLVVPAGARSVSVQNIGSDNINIVTDSSPATVIDPGISLTFDAQEGKTLGAYTFTNSTGSSLYIVTQVR